MKLPEKLSGSVAQRPWLPYVAPFATFLALTSLEGMILPNLATADRVSYAFNYIFLYTIKILIVTVACAVCSSAAADLRPLPRGLPLSAAVVLGLLVAALWVAIDPYYPRVDLLGKRTAFDPTALPVLPRMGFLAVRLYGLVVVVPLIEEVFWRSFLMRWMINPDFKSVPIGKVTWSAAAITSVLFALEHPEWLPGLITGFAWAGLLAWSRSVGACWISHLVANLALGVYVLASHRWEFW
jgi:CAAX prenyl protease-like protein